MPECPDCSSFYQGRKCQCGWQAPSQNAPQADAGPMLCPIDGAVLGELGWCKKAQGYPFTIPCPFVCPLCRGALGWSGECHACHGTNTGQRARWAFPGDGYYTHDAEGVPIGDGKHYVKQQGYRTAAPQAVNSQSANEIARILGKYYTGEGS